MKNNSTAGWGHTDREGLDEAEKKQKERRNKGYMPLRFWLANDAKAIKNKDNECDIIILDEAFAGDDEVRGAYMIREHTIKGADGKFYQEGCCSDFADCPVCQREGKVGYNVAFLTVIALKEWTDKKGNVHDYSKMLLPVKLGLKNTFLDLQSAAEKQGKSMRGMVLRMRRSSDSKAAAIGEPVMDTETGKLFRFVSEKWLAKEFGHDPVTDRDGKVVKEADEDIRIFDYASLFPKPDPDDLNTRYGGTSRPGSRASTRQFSEEDTSEDDDAPVRGRKRAAVDEEDDIPGNGKATQRKRAFPDDSDAGGDDDAPVRRRGATRTDDGEPPARSRTRRRSEEDDTVDGW